MLIVIDVCRNCAHSCEECFAYIIEGDAVDVHSRIKLIEILNDCIDICNVSARYLNRYSRFSTSICQLCSEICTSCAEICEPFNDTSFRTCTKLCRECAEICHNITEMASGSSVSALQIH